MNIKILFMEISAGKIHAEIEYQKEKYLIVSSGCVKIFKRGEMFLVNLDTKIDELFVEPNLLCTAEKIIACAAIKERIIEEAKQGAHREYVENCDLCFRFQY